MPQIDARGWIFEVSDGAATPVWSAIPEITEFTLNSSENEESADTTTFGSAGMHESQAMQRGATLEITGRKVLTADGTAETAQGLIEDYALQVGEESLFDFRFRHVSQPNWVVWTAWVTLGEQGGGNNAKTSWSCTLHRSGASTTEAAA